MGWLIRSRAALIVLIVLVLLLGAFLGGAAILRTAGEQEAETTAQEVAAPLSRLCQSVPGEAAAAGANCPQAAAVARDGVAGSPGDDGRGVVGTSLRNGRLVIAYSDGTTSDVGPVVGPAGPDGANGVGISATTIEAGQLVVTYTDGRRADVGTVVGAVGATGRGITSVAAQDGRLIVTYTDGDVVDAGPLPMGEQGEPGATGPEGEPAPSVQSVTRTYSDGTTERCTRTGGPDTDPVLDCTVESPPPVEPEPGGEDGGG